MTEGALDKHVLLIDFDPVAAELTGALLATRGIPFALARNHAELDRALAGGPPALVVIDPARPDEAEGMRICASIAERLGSTGKVPIILASRSLAGPRWKALAREAGAELFLERPKDDRLLVAAAERALAQAAAAPPAPSAPTAAPATPRATAPRGSAVVTTASALRPPPPAENELENMVDQMFAQWFAEGEGPDSTASGPLSVPPLPRSAAPAPAGPRPALAAAATAAPRTTGVGAAVLEPSLPPAPEVGRTRSAATTPAAAAPSPAEPLAATPPAAPVAPRPAPAAATAIAAPPSGASAPTKTSRPAPAPHASAAAPAPAPPIPPTPFAALPQPQAPASVSPLKRPLAIAAAVALIGVGAGALYLQKSGPAGGDTESVEVSSARPSLPLPAEPAGSPESSPERSEAPTSSTGGAAPRVAAATAPESPKAAPATAAPAAAPGAGSRSEPSQQAQAVAARPAATTAPASIAPPVAAPAASTTATPATLPPPTATPAAEAGAPHGTPALAAPAPQADSEFIPDIAPDGTIPAADPSSDATLARYTAPQLIPSTRVSPAFPPGARQMRMTGQVKLQVKVRADGSVGAVTVLSEPKPAVGFGKAAETAVRQWRYRPATMGSRAVESEIVVVVNFAGE
ncbi:MAG: TonB family protein [Acidobacteria bacterium]|nr:TonB family protein [Acidobacteriota bacterium]